MADEEPARVGDLIEARQFAHEPTGGAFVLDRRDLACLAARFSQGQKVS